MNERPIHVEHPARPGQTLCGCLMGSGCRIAAPLDDITCEGCRAVVKYCRETVRIGVLRGTN